MNKANLFFYGSIFFVIFTLGIFGLLALGQKNENIIHLTVSEEELIAKLDTLTASNASLENLNSIYEETLNNAVLEISDLQNQLEENRQLLEELQNNNDISEETIASLNQTISDLNILIEEKDAEISELNSVVANNEVIIADLNATIDSLVSDLNSGNELFQKVISGDFTEIKASDFGNITELRPYAFYGCDMLISVEIPESITTIGVSAFEKCSSLKYVDLPNSLTRIESNTFNNCSALESIILPSSLVHIGYESFRFSGLTSIIIPSSVNLIDGYAFYGCNSLTEMTLLSPGQTILNHSTGISNATTKIYVPSGTLEAYQTAGYWSQFADLFVELGHDFEG